MAPAPLPISDEHRRWLAELMIRWRLEDALRESAADPGALVRITGV